MKREAQAKKILDEYYALNNEEKVEHMKKCIDYIKQQKEECRRFIENHE